MKLFGLQKIREQHGLTQRQLGERIGSTRCAIADYERRRNPVSPSFQAVLYLTDALGYGSVDAFLADAATKPNPRKRKQAA